MVCVFLFTHVDHIHSGYRVDGWIYLCMCAISNHIIPCPHSSIGAHHGFMDRSPYPSSPNIQHQSIQPSGFTSIFITPHYAVHSKQELFVTETKETNSANVSSHCRMLSDGPGHGQVQSTAAVRLAALQPLCAWYRPGMPPAQPGGGDRIVTKICHSQKISQI